MAILFGDFETKSVVGLQSCGAHVYAKDPSTDLLCYGFAFDDEPVNISTPADFKNDWPLIEALDHVASGGTFVAHNAPFELLIWNNVCVPKYGWPALKPEQVVCTMAMAYAMALPGALEKLAPALGLKTVKDMAGNRVMMQLAQPRSIAEDGSIIWWNEEAKLQKLYDYCKVDVVVERMVYRRLLHLSPKETEVWRLDHRINDRGIGVDLFAIERAIEIVESEKIRLNLEMRRVTGNSVATCNAVKQLTDWLTDQGVPLDGVAKNHVIDALKVETLPLHCREALTLRQEAAKASTAKLVKMRDGANGGRIRGMFQYCGAGTGRWAGRRIQLQNLPRNAIPQESIDDVFELLHGSNSARDLIDLCYGPPLSVISDCLRGFLIAAPGKVLTAVDFSAIEARVLAWLAGEEKVLVVFRTHGKIYEASAADIYRVHISEIGKKDPRRNVGKVSVLAFGFQGGKGAFQVMAKNYGVVATDDEADAHKNAWRAANQKIVRYWYDVEDAAIRAVLSGGEEFRAGHPDRQVTFKTNGSFLWCLLPSRRALCYPYPKVEPKETPWGAVKDSLTYMSEDSTTRKWQRSSTYGGSLVENITQAVARDLLVDAMFEAESHGYPVVLHVHDELVCETEKDFGSLAELERLVSKVPPWAKGLPIAAEGWRGIRYRKG